MKYGDGSWRKEHKSCLVSINVINFISDCLAERNILVLMYFSVPFQGVSRFLKEN